MEVKKRTVVCITTVLLCVILLSACAYHINPLVSGEGTLEGSPLYDNGLNPDQLKKTLALELMARNHSANYAEIGSDGSYYYVNLYRKEAMIRGPVGYYSRETPSGSVDLVFEDGDPVEYVLDDRQVKAIGDLLSEYTLVVYKDDGKYYPTGEYCTQIELFSYKCSGPDGDFQTIGSLRYPDDWENFCRTLVGLITGEPDQTADGIQVLDRHQVYNYQLRGIADPGQAVQTETATDDQGGAA